MFQAFGNFSDCRGCPYSGCADYEDRCIGRFEELISGALARDTSGRLGSGFNKRKSKDHNAVNPACTVRTKRVVLEKVKLSTCHFFVLARWIPMQSFLIRVHARYWGGACSSGTWVYFECSMVAEAGNKSD